MLSKKYLILMGSVCALAIPTSFAIAAAPGDQAGKRGGVLQKVDVNQDGSVDLQEYTDAALTRFAKVDGNGDGLVTKEERQAAGAAIKDKMSQRRTDRAISKTDTDGDDALSREEIEQRRADRAERGQNRPDRGKRDGSKRTRNNERENPDTNGDGVIDTAEVMMNAQTKFTALDTDANGLLSAEELKAGAKSKRGKSKPGKKARDKGQ